jgi:hypothetical protein
VPGKVEDLFLIPGSHSIFVNWKKPITNEYCVTHYVVQWLQFPNASIYSSIVPKEENSFVIEDLDAVVQYEVSVLAVNVLDVSLGAATGNTTTETDGKYETNIISFGFVV